jgi:hypothetical protein
MGWFSKGKVTEDSQFLSDPKNPFKVDEEEGEWVTISHKKAEDEDKNVSSEDNEDGSTND